MSCISGRNPLKLNIVKCGQPNNLPEYVDGDAEVLRRHVVEPHGRNEEHVTGNEVCLVPFGRAELGKDFGVLGRVNVHDAGLVAVQVCKKKMEDISSTSRGVSTLILHISRAVSGAQRTALLLPTTWQYTLSRTS